MESGKSDGSCLNTVAILVLFIWLVCIGYWSDKDTKMGKVRISDDPFSTFLLSSTGSGNTSVTRTNTVSSIISFSGFLLIPARLLLNNQGQK